jgi:uncharacterized coiled-coil DUF342 family protein
MRTSDSIREKINDFQEKILNLKSKRDKNSGMLQASMKSLEDNFNFKTVESAEKALERWRGKKDTIEKELNKLTESFYKKYCEK